MSCKYCDFKSEDSAPNIWSDSFKFGLLGRLDMEAYISDCNKDHKPVIEVQADICDQEDNSIDLGVKRIPIYFCPFCGRDLMLEDLHDLYDIYNDSKMCRIIFTSLRNFGIRYIEDMSFITRKYASQIKGLGKRSLSDLDDIMKEYDVSYSETNDLIEKFNLIHVGDVIRFAHIGSQKKLTGTIIYKEDSCQSQFLHINIKKEDGNMYATQLVREIMSIEIIKSTGKNTRAESEE